jgi:type IV secretion system protein VirB3
LADQIQRDRLFLALTRPQMFAGVTYSFFIANSIVSAEFFLIFKTFWVVAIALAIHLVGMLACLKEPRFFDLWIAKVSRCPRVKNYGVWGCNSYSP